MRKFLLLFLCAFFAFSVFAQTTNDPQLKKRLDEYMLLNKQLNFKELMEYIHPSLFKMAPKEQLITLFEQTFNNENMRLFIDSISVSAISPSFAVEKAQYRKVDYYMEMGLKWKDSSAVNAKEFVERISSSLQAAYPGAKVEFNPATQVFLIKASSILLAIKDNATTPWMFLGYSKTQEALKTLFPQKVAEHFNL